MHVPTLSATLAMSTEDLDSGSPGRLRSAGRGAKSALTRFLRRVAHSKPSPARRNSMQTALQRSQESRLFLPVLLKAYSKRARAA